MTAFGLGHGTALLSLSSKACWCLLLCVASVNARVDIPARLYRLYQQSESVVPLPESTVKELPEALTKRKRLHGHSFATLSPPLQRALLWDSGYVVAGDGSGRLVEVKVPCGKTMNDLFMTPTQVAQQGCALVTCNTMTLRYAHSNCSIESLRGATLCAVVESDEEVVSSTIAKPIWSQDGDYDSESDPQIFKWVDLVDTDEDRDSEEHIFTINEKPLQQFADNTAECPSRPSFIVPCRKLEDSQSETWCSPESGVLVDLWLVEETEMKEQREAYDNALLLVTILAMAAGVLFLCTVTLLFCFCRKRRSRETRSCSSYALASPSGSSSRSQEIAHPGVPGRSPALLHLTENSWGTLAPSEIEALNTRVCQKSAELTEFYHDQELSVKRLLYSSLHFQRLLAKGANGEVWVGECSGQVVAIKRLFPDKCDDLRSMEVFAREIRLASVLQHDNIVRFVGFSWRTLYELCMVSEFMPRGDLGHFLVSKASRSLTWQSKKLSIASDIANALVYLHSLAPVIIHRDLKSLNVLITETLVAKLSDFGLSRERSFEETMTMGIGTLLWTAPEILRGDRYTEKVDIYSFGIVLSEIDTCLPPYSLNDEAKTIQSRKMHLLPLIRQGSIRPKFSNSCPPAVLDLAQSCMALDPDQRPTAMKISYMLKSKIAPELQDGQ